MDLNKNGLRNLFSFGANFLSFCLRIKSSVVSTKKFIVDSVRGKSVKINCQKIDFRSQKRWCLEGADFLNDLKSVTPQTTFYTETLIHFT